jgi:hypothetical protein
VTEQITPSWSATRKLAGKGVRGGDNVATFEKTSLPASGLLGSRRIHLSIACSASQLFPRPVPLFCLIRSNKHLSGAAQHQTRATNFKERLENMRGVNHHFYKNIPENSE